MKDRNRNSCHSNLQLNREIIIIAIVTTLDRLALASTAPRLNRRCAKTHDFPSLFTQNEYLFMAFWSVISFSLQTSEENDTTLKMVTVVRKALLCVHCTEVCPASSMQYSTLTIRMVFLWALTPSLRYLNAPQVLQVRNEKKIGL